MGSLPNWIHVVNSMQGGVGTVVRNLCAVDMRDYQQDVLDLSALPRTGVNLVPRRMTVANVATRLSEGSVLHLHSGLRSWYYASCGERGKPIVLVTLHGVVPRFGVGGLIDRLDARMLIGSRAKLVAVSRSCREEFLGLVGRRKNYLAVDVVPNGTFLPTAHENGGGLDGKPLQIVFVGGLWKNKGINLFLEIVAEHAMHKYQFTIFGQGPEHELVERAVHRFSHLSWEKGVFRPDLIFKGKNILLFPSAFEGCPMAVLEAMAYGVVPIAADIPALREIVVNSKNGVLVPGGDVRAYTQAILKCASDREYLRSVSLGARSSIQERYTVRTMVQKYRTLVELTRQQRR